MSGHWPKVRLGEVLRLDLERVPIDPSATYPMVGVLSFGRGLFDREPIENGNTSYKHFFRLKAEHVVMSQLFGWEGALALSSHQFAGKFLSPQFPTFLCDLGKLDRDFLGWVLRRPALWEDLASRASGMGDRRRTLNPDALFACEIPLPPLSEQRRILARIVELAAKIHEAHTLRMQASGASDALMNVGLRRVFERHSCQMGILGDGLLTCRNGISRRPGGQEEGPIVLRLLDVSGGVISLRSPRRGALTEAEIENYSLDEGDLLAVRVNGSRAIVGRFIQFTGASETVCYNDHLIRIRLDRSRFEPAFVARMASSPQARTYLESVAITTAGQLTVNQGMLANMPLPKPPLAEQRRIVAELDALQAEVDTLKRHQADTAAELDALLPAILDRAFRGEL